MHWLIELSYGNSMSSIDTFVRMLHEHTPSRVSLFGVDVDKLLANLSIVQDLADVIDFDVVVPEGVVPDQSWSMVRHILEISSVEMMWDSWDGSVAMLTRLINSGTIQIRSPLLCEGESVVDAYARLMKLHMIAPRITTYVNPKFVEDPLIALPMIGQLVGMLKANGFDNSLDMKRREVLYIRGSIVRPTRTIAAFPDISGEYDDFYMFLENCRI